MPSKKKHNKKCHLNRTLSAYSLTGQNLNQKKKNKKQINQTQSKLIHSNTKSKFCWKMKIDSKKKDQVSLNQYYLSHLIMFKNRIWNLNKIHLIQSDKPKYTHTHTFKDFHPMFIMRNKILYQYKHIRFNFFLSFVFISTFVHCPQNTHFISFV